MTEQLVFDPEQHKYTLDGEVLPSVTTILHELGLTPNYVAPQDVMAAAMYRGQAVHKATELLDQGELDQATLQPEWIPYLIAYNKFLKDVQPRWEHIEHRVFHRILRYAGTMDRVGIVFGKYAVLDIKSGSMSASTALQLAGYADTFTVPPLRYGLLLQADENYKLQQFKEQNDFRVFKSAVEVYKWRQRNVK